MTPILCSSWFPKTLEISRPPVRGVLAPTSRSGRRLARPGFGPLLSAVWIGSLLATSAAAQPAAH
ncbi:MAG: hypothetical protein MI919_16590, partial [Holophagales bacterium]|nr:hypothetical protein [Holophagales bacterium]